MSKYETHLKRSKLLKDFLLADVELIKREMVMKLRLHNNNLARIELVDKLIQLETEQISNFDIVKEKAIIKLLEQIQAQLPVEYEKIKDEIINLQSIVIEAKTKFDNINLSLSS